MDQRTTEWIELSDTEYHNRQFREPYRSTVLFCDWLEEEGLLSRHSELRVLDMASGQGANMYYMAKRYPGCRFIGIDINSEIVKKGNDFFEREGMPNCRMEAGDLYQIDSRHVASFDAVVIFQTLSWLPEFQKPLDCILALNPKWIALTSLFYEGEVSCKIEIEDRAQFGPDRPVQKFYNIYSVPQVLSHLRRKGYGRTYHAPFEIDIDLAKPVHGGMGTHTEKLRNGNRIQISGPLMMPWYFLAAHQRQA